LAVRAWAESMGAEEISAPDHVAMPQEYQILFHDLGFEPGLIALRRGIT
jgi:hypothetical protein